VSRLGDRVTVLARRPALPLALAALVLGPVLAGCTSEDGPPASDTADELAAALTAGRLPAELFDGGSGRAPQRAWKKATAGMTGATPEVTAGDTTEDEAGETATATLTYAWDLPETDETWTQEVTARLVRVEPDDGEATWKVRLQPALFGLRAGERLDLGTSTAPRAAILGAGGAEIVKDRPVVRFGVDKAQVDEAGQAEAARRLAGRHPAAGAHP